MTVRFKGFMQCSRIELSIDSAYAAWFVCDKVMSMRHGWPYVAVIGAKYIGVDGDLYEVLY